ncbi:MAG: glycosyltransferase family 39 protein [Coleofasciculus sp. G3-WIS-01]|uniref:ArnT family glycosyltransferase n=1 Tax=Coleofasciculus sp. G3-WIS-01 TaxID=3069528 RepID=UPI0032FFF325
MPEPTNDRSRLVVKKVTPYLILLCIVFISLYFTKPMTLQIKWFDETLYYTVAQNIRNNFDFNSHHYISSSIISKGYPTKDTHLPGYPLILSLGFLLGGINEKTPFFVNYCLLTITVILTYRLGKRLANHWVGIGGVIVYLLYPLTLMSAQSIMSETSAATITLIIVTICLFNKEGFTKGLFLSLALGMAYLIKPFLLAFMPITATWVLISKRPDNQKTLLGLLSCFVLLFIVVLYPLSQNREIYPYTPTEVLSSPGLLAKIHLIIGNFKKNIIKILRLDWKSGEGMTTLSMLLLCLGSLFNYFTGKYPDTDNSQNQKKQLYSGLVFINFNTLIIVLVAILIIYDYVFWRGSRALYFISPLLSLLFVIGLYQWIVRANKGIKSWQTWSAIIIGLVSCIFLYNSSTVTWQQLRLSQHKQYSYMSIRNERLKKVVDQYQLKPQAVISQGNFYFAIDDYPVRVIWKLPVSLSQLAAIEKRVTVDLIELKEADALFQENQRKYGGIEKLGDHYKLIHREAGFYYYKIIQDDDHAI